MNWGSGDRRQKEWFRISKAELLHSPVVQPRRIMQGGCVANQTTFRLQESQAMLYASTAMEFLKLNQAGKYLS
jgi:hypothetical protein